MRPIDPLGRQRKPRKPKANSSKPKSLSDGVQKTLTQQQRKAPAARRHGSRATGPVAAYLDSIHGEQEVNATKTIESVNHILAASAASRLVESEAKLLAAAAPKPKPETNPYTVDVSTCIALHKTLTNASLANLGIDVSSAATTVERNWFSIYGSLGEEKRSTMNASLVQFLEGIDLADPFPASSSSESQQSQLAEITDPETMFGEDVMVPWYALPATHGCILLYKAVNAKAAGLVYRLDDGACCWRSTLWDRPRFDWQWVSLRDALAQQLEKEGRAGGVTLQHRPKSAVNVSGRVEGETEVAEIVA